MSGETAKAMAAYQAMRRYVLAFLIGVICFLLIFSSSLQSEMMHELLEAYGLALILVGIGGRLWSTLYIGGRKSAEVVSTGPYSVVRNPLYFFSTLAAAGVGAQTGSFAITALAAAFCMIAFYVVALREERHLKAVLGEPYRAYLERVPRFFPDPRLFKDRDEVTFRPRIFNRTLVDGLAFFAALPFFELIERGQEMGLISVLFRLY
ncbi:methyltransferase family protein [Chelativorans salis]|uniref:Isoprenylcysteine carboxylmethyltransferase family protein n=1 Tax=Chelativorans salis TaxID=2978478 RepID=A0ABT2LVF3_9HYPH|nr:isoprenylcysteine carboxylmethyltransferase family protein [Chelativorans sp. EGI FJ00035]MCT7378521.1 isoprenylcysteine carboxylmethyltransferase family protein [Chelativorans sp. EGI FJ00035]